MHTHGDAGHDAPLDPRTRRLLLLAVVPMLVATMAGLLLLWPSSRHGPIDPELGFPDELLDARVIGVTPGPCQGTQPEDKVKCEQLEVELAEGLEAGTTIALEQAIGPGSPELEVGDPIVVGHSVHGAPGVPPDALYYFADYQREAPLKWLGLLFAVAVIALGRWRGLMALVALGLSLVLLLLFVLPAILEGSNPVLVSIVGSAAVMVVALYLSHGVNARTTSALLGTLVSLCLTGLLAVIFVNATRLTGLSSEEATFLRISAEQVNLQGLLLGGIIIGSLGVLDDVTVTQASAVWELKAANPAMGPIDLYRAALRIGRDHIASTVNTLVLAYAGASLPLLVLFTQAQRGIGEVATGEVVAIEIVRTLVGSIGLVASVPVTTGLGAVVVSGRRRAPHRGATPEAT